MVEKKICLFVRKYLLGTFFLIFGSHNCSRKDYPQSKRPRGILLFTRRVGGEGVEY